MCSLFDILYVCFVYVRSFKNFCFCFCVLRYFVICVFINVIKFGRVRWCGKRFFWIKFFIVSSVFFLFLILRLIMVFRFFLFNFKIFCLIWFVVFLFECKIGKLIDFFLKYLFKFFFRLKRSFCWFGLFERKLLYIFYFSWEFFLLMNFMI